MANTFATNDVIGKVALAAFMNNLSTVMTANQNYREEFLPRRGDTIRIDQPLRTTVRTGATASVQNITQNTTQLAAINQVGIDFTLTTQQRRFDLESLYDQLLEPMMRRLAIRVDSDGVNAMSLAAWHTVGTAGTPVNSFSTVNNARAKLMQYGVEDPAYLSMNPVDGIGLQNALQNSFNSMLNKNISERGVLGNLAGLDVYMSANLTQHVKGVATGTPVVNGASQTGTTLVTDGWTASTTGILKAGDIITLANVYGVNPANQTVVGSNTDALAQFVVQADVNSDSSGNATISILPAITPTTAYQTVSASPADNAAISVVPSYNQNFVYSKSGLTFAPINPGITEGAAYSKIFTGGNGIVLRLNQGYDVNSDVSQLRFDVFYAWGAWGEYIVKVLG